MRLIFSIVLLIVAIFYTYLAFYELSFLTFSGRMGPGFFPRIIGVVLVAALLYTIIKDLQKPRSDDDAESKSVMDSAIFIGLTVSFGLLLIVAGYLIAIPAYVGFMLFYFNRKKYLINTVVTLATPATIHFLFGSALNASLPHGMWW